MEKIEEILKIIEHLQNQNIKDTRSIQQIYEYICDEHAKLIIQNEKVNQNLLTAMIHLNVTLSSSHWKNHLQAVYILLKK